MATTANLPPGATPTKTPQDPFTATPTHASTRYASLDADQFSLYSSNSPSQAKRALEAHLRDTDRRIQDASRLGTTLLQQRKDLSARLKEVEEVRQDNEVPADLRRRLADLEKEYNEVGKESARAFLPKSQTANAIDPLATPSAFSGKGRESPTKSTAPSRRQRNQPSNRVHDIEFATEISTSLLAQVRSLQTALLEKDEELKDITLAKARVESEAVGMAQRIKHMDDNEQRYKDENWSLETRLQELESSHNDVSEKHQRLMQTLVATQSEKAAAQRDLDDLKLSHEKLNDDHTAAKRQQESELHSLRRDAASHETDRENLHKQIEELSSRNLELAQAVSYRFNQSSAPTDTDFVSAEEDQRHSDGTPEDSEPASPVKGTPRHGMLESETLKSSLNHAHRMIQNLKNNIHREKTEKIELKRMLQDARDELETRRSDSGGVAAKKRRSEADSAKFRKPARPLGAIRSSTTEITEDEESDWEDHNGIATPSKSRSLGGDALAGAALLGGPNVHGDSAESTDAAFETATERGGTTDAFETGREGFDDDSDDLTETESPAKRSNTIRGASLAGLAGVAAGDRQSFQSTASLSPTEELGFDPFDLTPPQAQQQKYRLRVSRGGRKDRIRDLMRDSPSAPSPTSSSGTPQPPGQSLGDELDALDEDSIEGTPSRSGDSVAATPQTERQVSVEPDFGDQDDVEIMSRLPISSYTDAGMMTEPWVPESETKQPSRVGQQPIVIVGAEDEEPIKRPSTVLDSRDISEELEPKSLRSTVFEPPLTSKSSASWQPTPENLDFSPVVAEELQPAELHLPVTPLLPRKSSKRSDAGFFEDGSPKRSSTGFFDDSHSSSEVRDLGGDAIPGTDGARPGAGFFGASMPFVSASEPGLVEPKVYTGVNGEDIPKRLSLTGRTPLGAINPNLGPRDFALSDGVPETKPLQIKKPMADGASQTVVSGEDIENMLRNKNRATIVTPVDTHASPPRPHTALGPDRGTRSMDSGTAAGYGGSAAALAAAKEALHQSPKRPASANSSRNTRTVGLTEPPLPEDRALKIAAAQTVPSSPSRSMGPPIMPASAYKQNRPRTPAEGNRPATRDGTTPRAPRQFQSLDALSQRSSISSFASEVDERLNGRAGDNALLYPEGVKPSTDPRMIQAITQTMIGEYLWKYTRKAGRSETSNTRHRRFFWVHPYTRTLYWSEKDPSTAGKNMLRAKSVAIDSVRAMTDDNAFPPGLHRRSIVVVTPGREIVFTAPTGQRHETWFNALSYLLLRTEQEKQDMLEAEDTIDQDDLDEFNPGISSSFRRSISRMTRRNHSRTSLSSYHSRTTRTSSPRRGGGMTLAERQSAAAASRSNRVAGGLQPPTSAMATATASSRYSTTTPTTTTPAPASTSGRLSSLTGRFRGSFTTSQPQGRSSTMSSRYGNGTANSGGIYDASLAASESAEDLRAVIEGQEREAERLENVRACCDGEFSFLLGFGVDEVVTFC